MKTHAGGCHCGAVRYEVATDLGQVIACNCSICTKRGLLLTFVKADAFKLTAGSEGTLSDYQFNKKVIHDRFCPACVVESFARGVGPGGAEMVAINVRCLDGVDLHALKLTPFDGKRL